MSRDADFPDEAKRLLAYYEEGVVCVRGKQHDALRNITAALKSFTVDELAETIRAYGQECIDRRTEEDRRYHPNNFFGLKAYFRGYLPAKEAANG